MNGLDAILGNREMALKFEGRRIRFVGTPDNPEWVAIDVGDILGIEQISSSLSGFDTDEKGMRTVRTPGGRQTLLTVYESGLYRLIFKSRRPEAKRFQKWVFGEVLPSIRKYGVYPPPEGRESPASLKPYTARVIWVPQARRQLRPGYWCVFIEGAEVLISAEQILGPANLEMKQYDLLDGSIGKRWSQYREGKWWAIGKLPYNYTYPSDDPRGTVTPWSYAMGELPYFKEWLHSEYMTIHFPSYLKTKYGAVNFQRALPVFASMGIPMLNPKRKK